MDRAFVGEVLRADVFMADVLTDRAFSHNLACVQNFTCDV